MQAETWADHPQDHFQFGNAYADDMEEDGTYKGSTQVQRKFIC